MDNIVSFMMLRGNVMELLEAIGDKNKQKAPEVLKLCVSVFTNAARFLGVSQNGLASLLGVNDTKTVRSWFLGKDTPRRSALLLLQRILQDVVLPPETANEQAGVASCFEAVCISLDEIERKAVAAGWEESEVGDAIREWLQEKKI